MSASGPSNVDAPSDLRPRLVLRVGFAGSQRWLTDDEFAASPVPVDLEPEERIRRLKDRAQAVQERERLARALPKVLSTLGHRLAALAPGVPVDAGREPRVSAYFARRCPLLRLTTGLCEGADALAGRLLESVHVPPDAGAAVDPGSRCLETELAAVLPFDVETYRRSRPAVFRAEFDRQLARCAWVLTLDGIYEKPDPDTERARHRRAKAYRAQSAFLIRHADVLVAAANPDEPGRAGGTLETVREALAFELPVVFIHTGREGDNVFLVEAGEDLHSVLAGAAPTPAEWEARLRRWVTEMTAAPDLGERAVGPDHASSGHDPDSGELLLREYFDPPSSPPRWKDGKRRPSLRERVWSWYERRFRAGPELGREAPLDPFTRYRDRASELNRHYGGLYRGAFLLNYGLAIVAVLLAAVSLALLATPGWTGAWLHGVLFGLAGIKLGLLIFIAANTRQANRERWNDRAVDCRYLAERLRAMYYLPWAGSHQLPAAGMSRFTSRSARQSAVDWLFESLVRALSPAELPFARTITVPAHDGAGTVVVRKCIAPDPAAVVSAVRDRWVGEQAKYHERNWRTMHGMHHAMERVASLLGWIVIWVVAVDLAVIGGEALHVLPKGWESRAQAATPWLICLSTVLPAVVAAMGGLRFQSECQRLAERSAVMRAILIGETGGGFPQGAPRGGHWLLADELARRMAKRRGDADGDPGTWSHDALRMVERVAADFGQEVSEWSVLYAKDVSEPG